MLEQEIIHSEPNSVGRAVLYTAVVVIQRHPFSRFEKMYVGYAKLYSLFSSINMSVKNSIYQIAQEY